jgi:membrane fusion protein (multidrug efflux system)
MLTIGACDRKSEQQAAAPPPPAVSVTAAATRNVADRYEFVGRVEAVDRVELRARVTGFLEKRLFEEGGMVKAGDLLFQIQQDEYKATLDERKADLASAEAQRINTKAQLARAEVLLKTKDIPEATVDIRRAEDATAAAKVLEAKAALEKAELDLGYTQIRAPVDGQIGRAAFTVGNLIGPDSGVLATIVSRDPMYVTFPVSQRLLLEYQKRVADKGKEDPPVVRVVLADGEIYSEPGRVNFADPTVDRGTDTVVLRAAFANPKGFLVDGQFANVRVEAGDPKERPVVPEQALQIDQAGTYVLVVGGEDKVEVRRITASRGGEGVVAVEKGLEAGERVIVDGALKVRPGQVVQATEVPMTTQGAVGQ